MTGLRDLMDRVMGLSWGLKMDRITGWLDLHDRVLWLSWGLKLDRITGLTGLGVNNGQDYWIAGFTG